MPIKQISIESATWYTPTDERQFEEGIQTKFKIQGLTGEEYTTCLLDAVSDPEGGIRLTGACVSYALKNGLKGWKNYTDESGKDVKFSIHNFKNIPYAIRLELAQEILKLSDLDGEAEKNL